ncbi:MAG TPA: uroporphyrinogen decarboxylase family protein [Rectinemataceae bacterium]|nr:uroporphyrinogen decarboxylase family protein [Rectinemataceae bacterium]
MSRAELVAAALDRKARGTFPLDFCGSSVTGIADRALEKLLAALGLPGDRRPVDSVQGISAPAPAIIFALGSSTLRIGRDRILPGTPSPEGVSTARDRFGVHWRRGVGELYFSQVGAPLGEGRLRDALDAYVFPEPEAAGIDESIAEGRAAAEGFGLFPVLDRDCAGIYEMAARLRGVERLYYDLLDDPEGVDALAERILDYKLRYWSLVLEAWGKAPAAIAEADDYGSEQSLLFAPDLIRGLFISRYRRLLGTIKRKCPAARVVFHSCGAVREILPALIEAGIDALNPVQFTAAGMGLEGLVRDFGDRIAFWGGAVDTKVVLTTGSPEDLRKELSHNAAILGSRGGFVCSTVHNIQADVPVENILAYLEAARGLGLAEARGAGRAA